MNFYDKLDDKMARLCQKGAFLTTKNGDEVNTMTISWGSVGFMWGKPVFMTMIRGSRHTYEMLHHTDEFVISIPKDDSLKKELGICGSKSGRDMDKIKECNLSLTPGKSVSTPAIKCAGYTYECKVVSVQPVGPELLPEEIKEKWYADENWHTFFYGEIVESYEA